jgi:hypothetical protein
MRLRLVPFVLLLAAAGAAVLSARPPERTPLPNAARMTPLAGAPARSYENNHSWNDCSHNTSWKTFGFFNAKADAPTPKCEPNLKWKTVKVKDGRTFRLVPREQLRVKHRAHTLVIPKHIKVPAPPPSFDWTRANSLQFPVLGNNQYGDCYYADMCHCVQTWTGNVGTEVAFDQSAVIRRYLQISGGDTGLADSDIYGSNKNGEWYGGIVGPKGPHKIIDNLLVSASDVSAISTAMYYFGCLSLTVSLCDQWLTNPQPGDTWGAGTADPNAGHAICLNGKNAKGNWTLQTWGFNPPIELTQAGLQSADPELMVCFSLDWFDPKTGKAPNGMSYDDLAALWQTLGGNALPPSPFGPPTPPAPPPGPPAPPPPPTPGGTGFTGSVTYTYVNGVLTAVTTGPASSAWSEGLKADLAAQGVSPNIIADVFQLLSDIRNKKGLAVIVSDLLKIVTDLAPVAEPDKKTGRREEPGWFRAA